MICNGQTNGLVSFEMLQKWSFTQLNACANTNSLNLQSKHLWVWFFFSLVLNWKCNRSSSSLVDIVLEIALQLYLSLQRTWNLFKNMSKLLRLCKSAMIFTNNAWILFMMMIDRWWKETDLAKDLNFSRDQPIKWYVASLICLSKESFYSEQRIQLAKSISFIYLIDDIFDVFGTLDELTIFTEAVCRL